MEVLSPSAPNGVGAPTINDDIDPLLVLEHIASLIQSTLGAARKELEAVGSLLSKSKDDETLNQCARFASESQVALYAQKDVIEATELNGHDEEQRPEHRYLLSSELSSSTRTVASVAFLKRAQRLDSTYPIAGQVQVINLPGLASLNDAANNNTAASPFAALHSIVHNALGPYFDAYIRSRDPAESTKSRTDPDAKTGVPGTKRRIAELEMSLLHLQQNTEIPIVQLPLHEVVRAAIADAEAQGKRPSIPQETLENTIVINSVQSNVNSWIKAIQAITKLSRDADFDSAAQEINFWISLEDALKRVEDELLSDGVQLTLGMLKGAKRHQAFLSFSADTGLKEALDLVRGYNQLMRDFPLDELSSATSLQKVEESLRQIFSHLNRKLRLCPYPIRRALKLVEGISEDLDAQMHRLLRGRLIMHLEYEDFRALMRSAESVWETWEEQLKDFTQVAREVSKRRSKEFVPIKVVPRHTNTQEQLRFVTKFRTDHEQLQRTIVNVLGSKSDSVGRPSSRGKQEVVILPDIGDVDAVQEVSNAFNAIRDIDALDISSKGIEIWKQAVEQYDERTSRVENSIIARLRDRLATAKTANEMFRVFGKFNALFVRRKVRGAIAEYQTQLLDNVKTDIARLHDRFKNQYGNSEAQMMAQLHDLPPVAGSINWVRQIEKQLNGYMKKVEAVLGDDCQSPGDCSTSTEVAELAMHWTCLLTSTPTSSLSLRRCVTLPGLVSKSLIISPIPRKKQSVSTRTRRV
jgi:dynein heavy chain 1